MEKIIEKNKIIELKWYRQIIEKNYSWGNRSSWENCWKNQTKYLEKGEINDWGAEIKIHWFWNSKSLLWKETRRGNKENDRPLKYCEIVWYVIDLYDYILINMSIQFN